MKKRFLLFLLLLPVVGCICLFRMESTPLALLYGGAAAMAFGAEALVFLLTDDGSMRWMRFMPLCFAAVPLFFAWRVWNSGQFLAGLAALVHLLTALCLLCGWGAAWGLTGFSLFRVKAPEKAETGEKGETEDSAGTANDSEAGEIGPVIEGMETGEDLKAEESAGTDEAAEVIAEGEPAVDTAAAPEEEEKE